MINKEDIKEGLKFCLPTAILDELSMCRKNGEYYINKIGFFTEHNNVVFTVESVGKNLRDEICRISFSSTDDRFDKAYTWLPLEYIMKNGEKTVSPQKERELCRDDNKGFCLKPKKLIAEFIKEHPEGDSKKFCDIIVDMYNTYKAKSHDYGNSFAELFEECGMTYAYGHMKEKLERVKSLMKNEAKVKGEGMKDSLLDLANYAILTVMELERKEGE